MHFDYVGHSYRLTVRLDTISLGSDKTMSDRKSSGFLSMLDNFTNGSIF